MLIGYREDVQRSAPEQGVLPAINAKPWTLPLIRSLVNERTVQSRGD